MTIKNQEITVRSTALPSHPLVVQKLRGEERMSGLFRFELDLICDDPELDLEEVLYAPVTLGIKVGIKLGSGQVGTSTREICGVFAEFEQHEEGQGWTKYRAVMVPKLWTTTCAYRSRVFQEKTIEELVTDVLTANALDPEHDFEFQLQREGADGDAKTRAVYPQREYVVQYEETDWHFLARWLEHEGVYFYFTNEDGEEKVVFADTDSSYDTSPFGSTFPYRPEAAGDGGDGDKFVEEEVRTFRCRQQRLPKQVHVTDYNWRIPSRLHYQADVREGGTGLMAEYNDHFKDEAQGKALAKLRAEELTCRARVYQGTSSCRSFRPGATFELTEHFRDAWNRSYLLTSVRHDAEQMISLESATVTGTKYENSFEAITDDQTWRPERTTDWPSIKGVMHASIDAEGDGHYAELDEHGRYKLTMPYDEALDAEDRKDGKASRWVRMAQPFAGKGAGMHFPLHKGTEVLVTHIDGDPDRPIITGAVPNPMTESPSNNEDPTSNAIRTTSGNLLKMDDHDEHPGFVMMDAMRSEVSDSRRRRKPSTDRQQANASGGQGNAERPQAAALPGGGRGSGSGGNHDDTQDARIDQNEGDIDDLEGEVAGIGTDINNLQKEIQDLKNPTTLSFTKSWKEFFKETVTVNGTTEDTAYKLTRDRGTLTSEQEDANSDKGVGLTEVDRDKIAYVDNSGSALSEGDDVPMNEANIVKALNYALQKGGTDPESPIGGHDIGSKNVRGTDAEGRVGKLLESEAGSLSLTAKGTQLRVWLDDRVTYSVGDTYSFADGSDSVSIGTGGNSYSETLASGYSKSKTWGHQESHSEDYGRRTNRSYTFSGEASFSTEFSGKASMSITVSVETANSINLGIFNSNSLFVGAKGGIEVCVAPKIEMEIGLTVGVFELFSLKGTLSTSQDSLFMRQSQLDLQKSEAALNTTAARLMGVEGEVSKTENYVSQIANKVNTTESLLSCINNAVTFNENVVSGTFAGVGVTGTFLTESETALIKSLQGLLTKIG